ncbi:hypothetical protein [Lyngbya sp. CCY1209]|uniref:hypothetical protein n=1 Tax=Lyngbya sp. CCY1209 TaxID=2886103 RepID=UPI002D777F33|nr:hypothetical protein [Lyngbya sp. CCY1209]
MTITLSKSKLFVHQFFPKISWYWWGIGGYLSLMLLLPILALTLYAGNLSFSEIWRIATDPVALSAYEVTFTTAFCAAAFNGIAGVAVAWVLVRYRFPGKRISDRPRVNFPAFGTVRLCRGCSHWHGDVIGFSALSCGN